MRKITKRMEQARKRLGWKKHRRLVRDWLNVSKRKKNGRILPEHQPKIVVEYEKPRPKYLVRASIEAKQRAITKKWPKDS